MPTSKTKLKNAAIAARSAALPSIPKELIDQFVTGPMSGEAVNAASMAFKKALIERALGAELGHHLGYPSGADKPDATTNQRNGRSGKTVITEDGPLRIEVPRDRDGSFEPLLIPKHERRFTGFDDKIIAMYARGMTVRVSAGVILTHPVDVKLTHLGEDDGFFGAVDVDPGGSSGDTSDGPKGRRNQGDCQAAGLLAQHSAALFA